MKAWRVSLGAICLAASCGSLFAQTPPPLLGSIEVPYAPLQTTVTIGTKQWLAGQTAYGPQGTPLVIYGANLGGEGVVQFIAYKNGAVDTSVGTNGIFNATVTLWTSNMLILTVPSGAYSGLVKVFVEGQYSNPLPFLVTGGTYAGTCPAGPPSNQLQITTSALADGQVNQSYSASLYSSGGTGTITWSVASGTLPAGLTLNQPSGSNPATITGTPTTTTGTNPAALTFKAADSASPQNTDEAEITLTVTAQSMTQGSIYSYSLSYDYAGNVTQFKDATYNNGPGIMGTWSVTGPGSGAGYDNLNRLTNASASWPDGTTQYFCWQYDAYGNRLEQEFSSAQFQSGSGGAGACTPQSSATLATDISSYGTNNWVTSTNARGVSAAPNYDLAGDIESDGANTYVYDGEGRVCAVSSTLAPGTTTLTGYLYDADGNRVAKGTITTLTCNPATNGFQFTEDYVTGPGGEELSMLNGSGTWQRTNVYGGGKLIGTYDLVHNPGYTPGGSQPAQVPWLHLHLEDALGTRRMQISGMLANLAQPEMDFQSLPYGDGFSRFQDQYADETYDDSSPLHFTGKERDAESGNDYFLARYYSSAIGRFMSPDWSSKEEPVPYARLGDPQSLNLYAYLGNDPLGSVDLDGHTSELDAATQRYALRIGVRTFDQIAAAQGKAQQLTFERFPVASRDVFIKWKLKWPTPSGGEIIQRVTGMMVTFQDNHAVKTPYNYWEAWRVDPGKTQVNDAKFDDQTGGLAGTHLRLRARFYPGLTNDELTHKYGFTIGGGPGAASLLSTTKDPQLPTGSATAPVDRTVTFK